MRSAYKVGFALLCSFFLFACGGGGSITDDGTSTGGGDGTTTTEVITISLETSSNDISASLPATLKATVSSSLTGAIANEVVTFSLSDESLGAFTPSSGTAKTNSEGIAEVILSTATTQGAVTVTASLDSGESATTGIAMAGDGAVSGENLIKLALKDAAGNSISNISFLTPGYIHVDYQDPTGTPIAHRLVTFTLNDTALATFVPNSGTALTDTDGKAVIKVTSANKEGAGTVNVEIDEQEIVNINFYSKGDAGVSGSSSLTAKLTNTSGTSITEISDSQPGFIEVLLADSSGVGIANEVVSFALNNSSYGTFEPSSGTALTNATGVAKIKLRTANVETAATVNVSSLTGLTTSISFYILGDGVATGTNRLSIKLVDSLGGQLSIISKDTPAFIEATYLDVNGAPLVGEIANFSTSLGYLTPGTGTAITNSSGIASLSINAGSIAGAAEASVSIASSTASIAFETLGDELTSNTILLALKDVNGVSITNISEGNSGYVHVAYTDVQSNPIANKVVSFSFDDPALATFVPNSGTALTDAMGNAIIKVVAGDKEGAGNITIAIDGEPSKTIGFYSTGDGVVTSSLSAKLVNATGAVISTVSAIQPGFIEVLFTDTNGTGIANESVTFTLNDNAVGVFEPSTGTALTDVNGIAKVKLLSANIETSATVSISTESGFTTSISFYMLGDGVAVGTNRLSLKLFDNSGNPVSVVSNATPAVIEATYLDLNGAPLAGKLATFTTTLGNLSPTTGTAMTNNSGIATLNLSAGYVAGAAELSVSIASSTASIAFETLGDEIIVRPIDSYILNLTVLDSSNNELRNINKSLPGSVRATLLKDGVAVPNALISFSIIGEGAINPTSGNALTDASGLAKVTLLTGNVEGAGTIQATFNLASELLVETFNYSVAGDAPGGDGENNSLTINLLDSLGNQVSSISQSSPGYVQVYLLDRNNLPLKGKVVSFSSTLGEFLPSIGTALTDNAGKADLIITAGTVEGAATVTASYGSTASTVSFTTAGDDIDPVAADPSITFEIYDCNGIAAFNKTLKKFEVCPVTDNITNQRPGILGAIVKLDGSNQPLKQVLVTAGTTLGAISPNSATAITNADGKAVLDLYSNGDVGAGEVSLKVKQVTSTKAFEIGRVDIDLEISTYIGANTLPAGGSTVIEVTVKAPDGSIETSQPFTLEFSSQCMSAGNAVVDSPVITNAGKGFATYRSINCQGTDTVTVSAITGASSVSATADITISPISVGSIQFISASPTELALKVSGGLDGAGARSETSSVAFKLLNEVGQPASSQRVCFELSTDVGDMVITPAPLVSDFVNCPNFPKVGDSEYPADIDTPNKYAVAYTDASGNVSVTVRSGTVPTPVKVFAVWQDATDPTSPIVANVSDSLTVTTGLADYNSFSLSATILNPEAWDHDGASSTITIRSADHFNNPVPDGTVINFRTEGGSIGASCQTIGSTGACSVEWTSQNPRPFEGTSVVCPVTFYGISFPPCTGTLLSSFTDNSLILEPRPGRSTITAFAIGEESFVDLNGNGLFDTGEDFIDLTEAFTDHNEDGNYRGSPVPAGAVTEEYIDFNANGSFDSVDGFYTGLLCASSSAASCTQTGVDNTQAQLNVFRNIPIVMSGSVPYGRLVDIDVSGNITPIATIDLTTGTGGVSDKTIYMFISDLNNNTLPIGTTITTSLDNGLLSSSGSFTIGNNASNRPLLYGFTVTREASPNQKSSGVLIITVKTPLGEAVSYSVSVRDDG
ncbi:invasin [Shewanella sp. BF02_Schw]|uniref:beta strand repeat-containing protein n=1 Tax=Shewanella sp. BF02_Schw TaxID=394908 RepID=UPI00177DD2F2|nr:invasin [Shewanella sp. BF02_Schw]MBO1896725.1 invasin [Shewanella sp. BF02_Schw]